MMHEGVFGVISRLTLQPSMCMQMSSSYSVS